MHSIQMRASVAQYSIVCEIFIVEVECSKLFKGAVQTINVSKNFLSDEQPDGELAVEEVDY